MFTHCRKHHLSPCKNATVKLPTVFPTIPLLFCGSEGRVVIAEVDLDAPGGLQDAWPPRVILPHPLCTHLLGAREGRAAGDTDTGLGAPGGVGELHFQGLCVGWLPHLSHCPLLQAAFF